MYIHENISSLVLWQNGWKMVHDTSLFDEESVVCCWKMAEENQTLHLMHDKDF